MARQMEKLTALKVKNLSKPGLYGDGGGLTLQITKSGVKSWLFRYMVDGKPFGMGLGPVHTITLAEARQKAIQARKQLLENINPLEFRRQKKLAARLDKARAMTFSLNRPGFSRHFRAG